MDKSDKYYEMKFYKYKAKYELAKEKEQQQQQREHLQKIRKDTIQLTQNRYVGKDINTSNKKQFGENKEAEADNDAIDAANDDNRIDRSKIKSELLNQYQEQEKIQSQKQKEIETENKKLAAKKEQDQIMLAAKRQEIEQKKVEDTNILMEKINKRINETQKAKQNEEAAENQKTLAEFLKEKEAAEKRKNDEKQLKSKLREEAAREEAAREEAARRVDLTEKLAREAAVKEAVIIEEVNHFNDHSKGIKELIKIIKENSMLLSQKRIMRFINSSNYNNCLPCVSLFNKYREKFMDEIISFEKFQNLCNEFNSDLDVVMNEIKAPAQKGGQIKYINLY